MAYMATIKILVDEANEATVYDGLNEMLRMAQEPVDEDSEETPWLLDWKVESVDPTNESLNDSIVNETYAEGDAFNDWVIFSRSEAIAQDGAAFWSNEYGWTSLDLATKFDGSSAHDLPISTNRDAMWLLAQYDSNV